MLDLKHTFFFIIIQCPEILQHKTTGTLHFIQSQIQMTKKEKETDPLLQLFLTPNLNHETHFWDYVPS